MCGYWGLPIWIDNRASRFLGRISCGQYLVHPLLLWVISKLGVFDAIKIRFENPYVVFMLCAVLSVLAVVLFAELAYRTLESPGIAVGEWLLRSRKLGGGP